jgi:cytochrome P450
VAKAATDVDHFRSGTPFVSMRDFGGQIPITLNPPDHTVFRRMLNKYFTVDRMAALEPVIRAYAREHLQPLLVDGHADVVTTLCQPLPARALSALMNLPDAAYADLIDHIAGFERMGWDPDQVGPVIAEVFGSHIQALVASRRHRIHDTLDWGRCERRRSENRRPSRRRRWGRQ